MLLSKRKESPEGDESSSKRMKCQSTEEEDALHNLLSLKYASSNLWESDKVLEKVSDGSNSLSSFSSSSNLSIQYPVEDVSTMNTSGLPEIADMRGYINCITK